jgi:iron-sulfur cluster repair protein YtfE (RIC family)
MDAIELIEKDHDRVEELFRRFKGGGGITGMVRRVAGTVTPRERRTALARIRRELQMHTRLEEEIFYPAARRTGDGEVARLLDESLTEHARVKELLGTIGNGAEDEELDARVHALEQAVQHHVSEEENELLPRVRTLIDERRRAELGRRMQSRKRASSARSTRPRARRAARTQRRRTAAHGRRKRRRAS